MLTMQNTVDKKKLNYLNRRSPIEELDEHEKGPTAEYPKNTQKMDRDTKQMRHVGHAEDGTSVNVC